MKCSRRSSVNFTVRPSARAASGTSSSSGHGWLILTPKPPPTSGVITSTWPRSSSSFTAIAARTPVEVWVEVHTWSRLRSGSQRATVPRPSIGWQALRSMVRSRASRCGAAAIAAVASPTFCSIRAPTLPGTSSWTRRSAARAASMPTTGGQQLVVDGDPADRVLGDVAVVGDHEGDRLAHVVDLVLGQRVLGAAVGERRVRDEQRQRLGHRAGRGRRRSRPRARPRRRAPRTTSMSTIRACACGERSTAACRVPVPTATSSTYRPWPRRNRWSSTRWTFWPISLVVMRRVP